MNAGLIVLPVAAVLVVSLVLMVAPGAVLAMRVEANIAVGASPLAVGVNTTTNKIYVANSGSGTVSVINGATNSATTVTVGTQPCAVGVNTTTNKIYVANYSSGTVSVINGATNGVTPVALGDSPRAIDVNPTTNKIYVANFGSGTVSVIDGVTNGVTPVAVGTNPWAVGVNPTTNKIYVSNAGTGTVSVIDGMTNNVTPVAVGSVPHGLSVNTTTNKIYVANYFSNSVSVIDGVTNGVTPVAVGSSPDALGVNPTTNKIYVANYGGSGTVSVIDGVTNGVTPVTVGTNPLSMGVNPMTNKIYVANNGSSTVSVIEGATNGVTTITVGIGPSAVGVNTTTNKIYVANSGSGTVSVIDGTTNNVTPVAVGTSPLAVGVNTTTNKIYVANEGSDSVSVLQGATDTVVATITVDDQPRALGVNPTTDKIYVANALSNSVSVIDGATNGVTPVTVGSYPYAIGINTTTNKIYVANYTSGTVSVIDGVTNGVTPVTVGDSPVAIGVNTTTNKIYVANVNGNSISVIDGVTNSVIPVAVGEDPVAIGVNTTTNKIYVANSGSGTVSVIDGVTNSVVPVTAGTQPQAVGVNTTTNKIYVANYFSNSVSVIDGVTNGVTPVTVGANPRAVGVNTTTNRIYVANSGSNIVSVIDGATNGVATVTVGAQPWAEGVNSTTSKIYVANYGSSDVSVIYDPPVPTINSLSPYNNLVEGPTFTLAVNGTGFASDSVVRWNGSNRTTYYVSALQLTASIPASDITVAGTADVTVFNPTPVGWESAPATFTINNPLPSIISLSPNSNTAGTIGFVLTVNGTGFNANSVVKWGGIDRPTSLVSGHLDATITQEEIASAGTVNVTVFNPTPGGGTSNAQTFTINNPPPLNINLSPSIKTAGDSDFLLTVNGTDINASSVIRWGGTAKVTTYTSGHLEATITRAEIASAGRVDVTVFNPAPGGGTSTAQVFTINNPVPTTMSLNPTSRTAGSGAFTLTVNGTSFVDGSVVKWNGSNRATTYVSASRLTAIINASDIASPGTANITVFNPLPGGGTSGARTFTVNAPVSPESTWYLAEGTTAWGFSTYISIENPNTTAVNAVITYMTGSGNVSGGTFPLPASSQTTVNPADKLGNKDFSTKVVCTEGKTIAVDRTMFWTGPGAASPEGHSSVGVIAPAKTWYLAEGASAWGFETWLLIQNPNGGTATAQVTYMIEGEAPKTVYHTVAPNSRQSFNMETDIGQKNASIKVVSNIPVIPERAMYWNNKGAGTDTIGGYSD
jgi:YVTN family beta-propeller protein